MKSFGAKFPDWQVSVSLEQSGGRQMTEPVTNSSPAPDITY